MSRRKQLTFDLDTNVLKQILGDKEYTKAYSDIRRFMEKRDFVHIEGSVYVSKQGVENYEVIKLLADLKKKYPYLTKCVRDIHQTDVGKTHSLDKHFDYDGTAGEYALKKEKPSVLDELVKIKAEQDAQHGDEPTKKKNKDISR